MRKVMANLDIIRKKSLTRSFRFDLTEVSPLPSTDQLSSALSGSHSSGSFCDHHLRNSDQELDVSSVPGSSVDFQDDFRSDDGSRDQNHYDAGQETMEPSVQTRCLSPTVEAANKKSTESVCNGNPPVQSSSFSLIATDRGNCTGPSDIILDHSIPSPSSSSLPLAQGSSSVLTGSSGFSPPPGHRETVSAGTSPTRLRSRLLPQPSIQTKDEEELSRFSLHPDGNAIFYWTGLVALATVFNMWTVLLRIAFPEVVEEEEVDLLYVCDCFSDLIYLADISVQMRTAFMQDGIPVYDSERIRQNYVRQQVFIRDVLSIFPTETFSQILPYFTSYTLPDRAARLNRLLKLHSVYKFYDLADSRTSNPNGIRAFRLTLSLATVIHWIGCLYYVVSEYEGLGINQWVYTNSTDKQHFVRKYVVCLYWSAMTLTTIGDCNPPETDLEYVFTGLTFLIGVFVFATVVGNVGDVIANMNATRQEFQSKMDQIKLYLTHRKVPASLQIKVKKWAEYSWSRTQATDEYRLLHMLPERLRAEIAVHVHLDTLCKVKIFQHCEQEFLCELVLKLRSQIYSPGDFICRAGETGREMYIINHGKVEVVVANPVSGDEVVVARLTEGKRTADVRSVGYSELLCLSRKDLMAALVEYPEAKSVLEQQARERIKNNLQAKRTFSVDNLMGMSSEMPQSEVKGDTSTSSFYIPSSHHETEKGKDLVEIRALIENLRQAQMECQSLTTEVFLKDEELRDARRRIAELEGKLREFLPPGRALSWNRGKDTEEASSTDLGLEDEAPRETDALPETRVEDHDGLTEAGLPVPDITINDTQVEDLFNASRFRRLRQSFYRGSQTGRFFSLDESLIAEDIFLSAPRHQSRRGSGSSVGSDASDNMSRKSSLRSDITGDEEDSDF